VPPTCCVVFQKNSLSNGIGGIDAFTRLCASSCFPPHGFQGGTVSCAGFVQSASLLLFRAENPSIPTPRASPSLPFLGARARQLSHCCPFPLLPALASINSILIAVDPAVSLPRTKLSSRDQRFHCVLYPGPAHVRAKFGRGRAGTVHHSVHSMRWDCTVWGCSPMYLFHSVHSMRWDCTVWGCSPMYLFHSACSVQSVESNSKYEKSALHTSGSEA
jgi:hypothetical protein